MTVGVRDPVIANAVGSAKKKNSRGGKRNGRRKQFREH